MSQISKSPLPKFLLGHGTEFNLRETSILSIDGNKSIGSIFITSPHENDGEKTIVERLY